MLLLLYSWVGIQLGYGRGQEADDGVYGGMGPLWRVTCLCWVLWNSDDPWAFLGPRLHCTEKQQLQGTKKIENQQAEDQRSGYIAPMPNKENTTLPEWHYRPDPKLVRPLRLSPWLMRTIGYFLSGRKRALHPDAQLKTMSNQLSEQTKNQQEEQQRREAREQREEHDAKERREAREAREQREVEDARERRKAREAREMQEEEDQENRRKAREARDKRQEQAEQQRQQDEEAREKQEEREKRESTIKQLELEMKNHRAALERLK